MKPYILASLIVFVAVLSRLRKKHTQATQKAKQSFWDKELAANNVRKKSLDDLNYVTIPLDTLPLQVMCNNEEIAEYISIIHTLSTRKIVNFTGITNTDLKLTYGTANITVLSEYDDNYSTLVTTLQRWAKILYDNGYIQEVLTLLEYAVSIGSDVSATYYLLADIYKAQGSISKITELYNAATALESKSGKLIAHTLQESYL